MSARIVSLAPSATSILCALGARKHLVGVSRWCGDVAPVNGLPELGDCWHGDTAKVAAIKPDLVIGSVPYKPEVVEGLLRRGLTFLAMNPRTLKDIYSDIELLGRLAGREKQGRTLVRRMQQGVNRIARKARRTRKRPRVYCEAWPNPFMLSPLWIEELVELAGGRFVPAPGGRIVSEQDVLQAKPEVIVLAWTACGMRVDANKVLQRPGWDRLPAFRHRQLYVVSDELLNTPAPPVVNGLDRLARVLHPEIFGEPTNGKLARVA